jgi:hypothetical protein
MKLRLSNLIVEEADRMGIVTTSILAQALRNANIPADLGEAEPGGETQQHLGDFYRDTPNYERPGEE